MSAEFSPELRQELLNDFYAECDELLRAIREGIATLDRTAGRGGQQRGWLEPLYRSVHTLKGIAAIAGVRPAEQLSHATEDLLRALNHNDVPLTTAHVDLLLDAAQCLESIIQSHQRNEPVPVCVELAQALRAASGDTAAPANVPMSAAPAPADPPADPAELARARGLQLWRCTFAPSPALDARGVNVQSVRERLGRIGEILRAEPRVQPNASIVFVFTLGLRAVPQDFESWAADGLRFEPLGESCEPAAPAGSVAAAAPELAALATSRFVRVDLTRLDELMRITGELVIQRSRLEDRIQQQFRGNESLKEIDVGFARSLRELRKAIGRVRLVPIAEIFTRLPLIVRDLARGSEKKARVVLEGEHTEIDKYVAERLNEPLLHLVRNAFAHGIETPGERLAAGKPAEATILLRATSVGDSVVVHIRDDGRGIDPQQIAARAKTLGVPVPESLDPSGVLQILAAPGFSTQETADRAAGRGIGMAVVASTVRELGGSLTLDSTIGHGTEFVLRLPLSVLIVDVIIVSIGAETCAVPQSAIVEIIQIPAAERRTIKRTEVVPYRDGLLPFVRLNTVFGVESPQRELLTLLVLGTERGATGLLVDRVRAKREVVVRPLTDPLVRVPGISGATELGDGRPILILDPHALTTGVVRPPAVAVS
ncbi:chemotaxis protein CheA [Opitutus terrae]|uniref:histidine kinase n=1 Tax=Opitutus terrae (strain DSM 11246 / JCM 15787 / PB90-1) TaxID=452637 RepID=B1ZY69_OPITP|nr:chemotaxis protein CheA [Opitutus terrae]ACB76215.1 CheA signal transduction histidine kinase [Opitutus terrae PB90-1]